MITEEDLKKIIQKQKYSNSIPRKKYVEKINSWMERKEIIILKGIRRCGKTHIMYQLMNKLPEHNVFYVNFDDYRFDDQLNTALLEKIIDLRDKKQKAYFFLDEIQRVKGFEKWLRTHYDNGANIKFIIGGSNISLLSPEMSTVLTGRNITFIIYTLSYDEFKEFTDEPIENYLEFGGFPEVVLEKNELRKRELLTQYLTDIVSKDIISKYSIDNIIQMNSLIKFLLTNPGTKISANKLASQLGIHKNTAQKYISYILDAFLVFEVPYFSYSAKTKYIGARASKYYALDNGLYTIASIKKNMSGLYENMVAIKLKQENKNPMYWQDKTEIDFIFDNTALQVTSTEKIPQREIKAFMEFTEKNKNFNKILITPNGEEKLDAIQNISLKDFISNNQTI